jgi:hypothetical protein
MDNDQIQDDELLNDEEISDVEENHDPVNAEKKSVDSVDKAAHTGPKAKKRRGDKEGGDKTAAKADKGIVRELYSKMTEMSQEELRALRDVMESEDFGVETEESEGALEDITYDMSEDVADLVESEATLSEGFKDKAATIMEMAVKSKLKTEVARLEESYNEQLEEAIETATESMVESIDGYLNHVVENWMEENKVAVENGLRTEIAEEFMTGLKDLFVESYIEVPEDKVDLVDDLAEQVESLENENNKLVDDAITMAEKLEGYERERIIFEMSDDLADTQVDKLTKLAENVDFDDEESFKERIATIKETYFGKDKSSSQEEITEDTDGEVDEVEISDTMARYLTTIRKQNSN